MALREILASFGFQIDDSNLKKANVQIDGVVHKLTNLKGLVGGALAGVGLGFFKAEVDELAKEAGDLYKASVKAGTSLEDFEKISYQTGLGTEQLNGLFRKLQQGIAAAGGAAGDAATDFQDADGGIGQVLGTKKAAETFKSLGIELKDAAGKSRNNAEVFQDVAQALAKLPDPAQKTALAIRIFGRSGADILPFLEKSPEKIKQLGEQFDLIGGFSEEGVKDLKKYTEEQKRLTLASNALKIAIVTAVVPAFTYFFNKLNEGITWFKRNVDTSQLLVAGLVLVAAAFVTVGGSAIAAAASTAAAWLAAIVPFALLYFVLDDLIHFIKGDANTAIGGLIVLLFGKEGESWISQVRKDLRAFIQDVTGAKDSIKELKEILGFIASPEKLGQTVAGRDEAFVAQRGVTRKARRREAAAASEAGFGEGERAVVGPTLSDAGKSLYSKAEVKLPGVTLAPVTVAGGKGAPAGPVTITHHTNVTQHIEGADAKDAADQSVDGIKRATAEDRRKDLAAVEARR